MSVKLVSSLAELQSYISQPKLTVVDFFATWCGPCMNIAPQVEQLATSKQHVNFCKVDVDRAADVMHAYPVRCMPTFKFFKGGNVLESFEGADINSIMRLVEAHQVLAPPAIPSDEELTNMKPKELLALMRQLHISTVGLFEKPELIEQIKKFR